MAVCLRLCLCLCLGASPSGLPPPPLCLPPHVPARTAGAWRDLALFFATILILLHRLRADEARESRSRLFLEEAHRIDEARDRRSPRTDDAETERSEDERTLADLIDAGYTIDEISHAIYDKLCTFEEESGMDSLNFFPHVRLDTLGAAPTHDMLHVCVCAYRAAFDGRLRCAKERSRGVFKRGRQKRPHLDDPFVTDLLTTHPVAKTDDPGPDPFRGPPGAVATSTLGFPMSSCSVVPLDFVANILDRSWPTCSGRSIVLSGC